MALNPQLQPDGSPAPIPGESFAYSLKGIKFELQVGSGYPVQSQSFKGTGHLFMSPSRLVFVALDPTREFQACEFPLIGIRNEKIHQPVFGANNFTATVEPVPGRGLNGPANFKITFKEGGLGAFASICSRFVYAARAYHRNQQGSNRNVQPPRPPPGQPAFSARDAAQGNAAYVDPSQPGTFYVPQQGTYAAPPPNASQAPGTTGAGVDGYSASYVTPAPDPGWTPGPPPGPRQWWPGQQAQQVNYGGTPQAYAAPPQAGPYGGQQNYSGAPTAQPYATPYQQQQGAHAGGMPGPGPVPYSGPDQPYAYAVPVAQQDHPWDNASAPPGS